MFQPSRNHIQNVKQKVVQLNFLCNEAEKRTLEKQELYDCVAFFEDIQEKGDYLPENIKLFMKRVYLVTTQLQLYKEKQNIHDKSQSLAADYDFRVLSHIYKVLEHVKENWNEESDEKRKSMLHNIVRSVFLLTEDFTNTYCFANGSNIINISVWHDIRILVQTRLSYPEKNWLKDRRFPIDNSTINNILKDLIKFADDVIMHEIKVGLRYNAQHPQARNPSFVKKLELHDNKIRLPYRSGKKRLACLHAVAWYYRDQNSLSKMIDAIEFVVRLRCKSFLSLEDKLAILRQLQVIGEACHDQNSSKQIKVFSLEVLSIKFDWDFFVFLRNKLLHNEWDLCDKSFNKLIKSDNFEDVQEELHDILDEIKQLQTEHLTMCGSQDAIKKFYAADVDMWKISTGTVKSAMECLEICKEKFLDQASYQKCRELLQENRLRKEDFQSILETIKVKKSNDKNAGQLFGKLSKLFRTESEYQKNIRNPNFKENFQQKIKVFSKLLTCSMDSAKQQKSSHPNLFGTESLIANILSERHHIKKMLEKIGVNDLFAMNWPEDTSYVMRIEQDLLEIFYKLLMENDAKNLWELYFACFKINEFCEKTNNKFHLRIDGLYASVSRGEVLAGNLCVGEHINDLLSFSKKCDLYLSLLNNSSTFQACILRMSRIQQYLVQIFDTNPSISNADEYRALRNFIHHSNELFESLDLTPVTFYCRYISLIESLPLKLGKFNDIKSNASANSIVAFSDIYEKALLKESEKPEIQAAARQTLSYSI